MNETKEIEGHWVGKEKSRYDFTLKLLEQKSTTRGYWVYRMKDKYVIYLSLLMVGQNG